MIPGAAGTGKSTIIELGSQWAQHLLQGPGGNPDQTYFIKAAFTGTAASVSWHPTYPTLPDFTGPKKLFHVISYESENNVEHQKVSGASSCAYYLTYTQNSPFPYSLGLAPICYFKNSAAIAD